MDIYEYWLEHTREMVNLIFGRSETEDQAAQREKDWQEYVWSTL